MSIDHAIVFLAAAQGLNLLYNILLSRRVAELDRRTERRIDYCLTAKHDLGISDKAEYEVVRTSKVEHKL